MNELQVFTTWGRSPNRQKGAETWWVLKDVCDVISLTLPHGGERLEEDEVSLNSYHRRYRPQAGNPPL